MIFTLTIGCVKYDTVCGQTTRLATCLLSFNLTSLFMSHEEISKIREITKKQHDKLHAEKKFRVGENRKRCTPGETEIHKWFRHACFLICGAFGCDSCGFKLAAQRFCFFIPIVRIDGKSGRHWF